MCADDVAFRGVTHSVENELVISSIDDRTLRLEGAADFDIRDFDISADGRDVVVERLQERIQRIADQLLDGSQEWEDGFESEDQISPLASCSKYERFTSL